MHFCGFWFLVGEDGTDVRSLVVNVNILDLNAVLCDGSVFHQDDTRIQRPLLGPRKQNGGAVEPSHSRDFAIDAASGWQKEQKLLAFYAVICCRNHCIAKLITGVAVFY